MQMLIQHRNVHAKQCQDILPTLSSARRTLAYKTTYAATTIRTSLSTSACSASTSCFTRTWGRVPLRPVVVCASMSTQQGAIVSGTPQQPMPVQLITTTFLQEALGLCEATPSTSISRRVDHRVGNGHQVSDTEPSGTSSDCAAGLMCPSAATTYLILLNWGMPSCLPQLWERAGVRICADGGCNRLHDELPRMLPHQDPDQVRKQYAPHLVKGDMDSVRPEVRAYYEGLGIPVERMTDQDTTDLTKCLQWVEQHLAQVRATGDGVGCAHQAGAAAGAAPAAAVAGAPAGPGPAWLQQGELQAPDHLIIVLGALGGRLDHTLGNLSTLHTYRHLNIALVGEGNLVRLVRKGRALIRPWTEGEGPHCGLIPLTGPAVASSAGLRWDLAQLEMHVGGLISTCNIIEGREVWVESNTDLVWTTQVPALN